MNDDLTEIEKKSKEAFEKFFTDKVERLSVLIDLQTLIKRLNQEAYLSGVSEGRRQCEAEFWEGFNSKD